MATRNDKFSIHPGYACGHDWDEFIEALEEAGLEKDESPFGWSQILHPRTTLWRSKDEGPFDIVTVELTHTAVDIRPFEHHCRLRKTECHGAGAPWWRTEGFADIANGATNDGSPQRAHVSTGAHGIVKDRFLETCPVCGKSSARSAARRGSAPPPAGCGSQGQY